MRVLLFIGLPHCGLEEFQTALFQHRDRLREHGILVPAFGRKRSHSRLYMAVSDPDRPDPLRHARGLRDAGTQNRLRLAVRDDLLSAVQRDPDATSMVLAAPQLSTLPNRSELERLKALLATVTKEITVILTVDEQARLLLRHYDHAIRNGRTESLDREIALARTGGDWFPRAVADWTPANAIPGRFPEIFGIPHWLDLATLAARWQAVFGKDSLHPVDAHALRPDTTGRIAAFAPATDVPMGWLAPPVTASPDLSDATLARWRRVNAALFARPDGALLSHRKLANVLQPLLSEEEGAAEAPPCAGALVALSRHFAKGNETLPKAFPTLSPATLRPDAPDREWAEPPIPASFDPAAIIARLPGSQPVPAETDEDGPIPPGINPAWRDLPEDIAAALANAPQFKGGPYEPHNRLGALDETRIGPAFPDARPPSSKAVIVGCMKNEAPYIVEWVAYHRQAGFDGFLIYTNDCSDGTDAILDRLQTLGYVQHRRNDDWKGQSPQQHALNLSIKEDIIRDAAWVAHIDVDEFVNIRTGDGTVADLLARMPDATNIAMTWRLFGHNGVERLQDRLVIEQFDHAAPRYCPKPHTNWGFKTMTRNLGTYEKLSCHRPTKPVQSRLDTLRWYNGSGKVMSPQYHEKGWRSDRANIGYDLVQLNHYALRSAEAFLVKRQRGRALHVDRSIGLGYWMRMDWNGYPDHTIKRNIPRVRAEMDRMFQDAELRHLHEQALAWHHAKIAELRALPEFDQLYRQVMDIRLSEAERVAVSVALEK